MDGGDNDILASLTALDPVSSLTGQSGVQGNESVLQQLTAVGLGSDAASVLPVSRAMAGGPSFAALQSAGPTPEQLLGGGYASVMPSFSTSTADTPADKPVFSNAPADEKKVLPENDEEALRGKYPSLLLSGAAPKVQNVVSMFNLGTKVDLQHIGRHAKNAEYNPKRFAAVVMRIREPKTTALIFASGKVVVTGANSEDNSKRGSKKFAKIMVKMGYPAKFRDFKIHNIVGSCGVNFPIRLEMLAADHGIFCSYEPELFPGLIYRMEQPKVVLLIFVSGKIVFTGAKTREDLYAAFDNIYPVLCKYDKSKRPGGPPPVAPPPEFPE